MVDNTVGVVVLRILSAVSRFPYFCYAYSVFVTVTLAVDEVETLLKTGKVVVLVTIRAVSTHLTQTERIRLLSKATESRLFRIFRGSRSLSRSCAFPALVYAFATCDSPRGISQSRLGLF
jgi:hypothetical protein